MTPRPIKLGPTHAKRLLVQFVGRDRLVGWRGQLNRLRRAVQGRNRLTPLPTARLSAGKGHTFFGYYDKTPFGEDGVSVLALFVPEGARPSQDAAQVGVFALDTGAFNPLETTRAWHWQQGCRLQWVGQGTDQGVAYNTLVNGRYGCQVRHATSGALIFEVQFPVYDIDVHGRWGLSLNFSRLHRLRPGYGYGNLPDSGQGQAAPGDDGVWLVDLANDKPSCIISLARLANLFPQPTMAGAPHYINHLSFAPQGDQFMFLHLWGQADRRWCRLVTADLGGERLRVLAQAGTASHYAWTPSGEMVITFASPSGQVGYYLVSNELDQLTPLAPEALNEDGHPSFDPSGRWLVTDTYPDRFGERRLQVWHPDRGLRALARFASPAHYHGPNRCDLHPRWDRSGTRICVDSAHEGPRAIYVLDVAQHLGVRPGGGGQR